MLARHSTRVGLALLALAAACTADVSGPDYDGNGAGGSGPAGGAGGSPASGGSFATGGSVGSGGALGTGGSVGSGGEPGTGGTPAAGGTIGAGGSVGFGGASGAGAEGGTFGSGGSGDNTGGSGGSPPGVGGTVGAGGTSSGSGGSGTAGTSSGSGGTSSGGSGGSSGGGDTLSEQYPCNGSTAGYDALVIKNGSTWTAQRVGGSTVYTGTDMKAAVEAGINSLTSNRTTKQKVLVQGDGTVAADTRINIANYTVLNVCGTIHVTGTPSGDNAALYARDRHHIDIPNVRVTGTPAYGLFFRNVNDLHIGYAEMRNTTGIGIRVDNHPSNGTYPKVRNIRIDYAHVEGIQNQGVETYGVDGLIVGTVYARNVRDSSLLLNDTINAEIGLIDSDGAPTGNGYAAFRMANRNGRYDNGSYPINIRVGEVKARGGGRGIFCVSESGGAEIKRVDILGVGTDPAIFIEDCYNVRLATEGGTVNRGSAGHSHRIHITARTSGGANGGPQFLGYSDQITIENLTVTNSPISESPCGGNNTVRNNTRINSTLSVCPGTDKGGN